MIKIEVNNSKRDWEIDYGYAFTPEFSANPHEKEVLFNMLNSFRIK